MTVIETEEAFQKEVLEKKGYVLADFYAAWCRPCKLMEPVMERAEKEREGMSFCKVNVEALPALGEAYHIMGTPIFILFKDGKEKGRIVGYHQSAGFFESLDKLTAE